MRRVDTVINASISVDSGKDKEVSRQGCCGPEGVSEMGVPWWGAALHFEVQSP